MKRLLNWMFGKKIKPVVTETKYYDSNGNHVKSIYTIPVGSASAEEVEMYLNDLRR